MKSVTEKDKKDMAASRGDNPKEKIAHFPSSNISAKIHREKIRLINTKQRTKLPEDTLKMFADVMELNSVYLSNQRRPENEPVIDSMIDFVARVRAWLD